MVWWGLMAVCFALLCYFFFIFYFHLLRGNSPSVTMSFFFHEYEIFPLLSFLSSFSIFAFLLLYFRRFVSFPSACVRACVPVCVIACLLVYVLAFWWRA